MTILVCGSMAYDTIMVFQEPFRNHILPDQIHILNVCFVVPTMRREFGGCAGNIAYNLLQEVGGADAIGPILLGLRKPVHVLQLGSSIRSIFNVVLIAVVDAQMKCETNTEEAIGKSKWWKKFKRISHDL